MTTAIATAIPAIGQPWAEQGGIYVGSRPVNGETHHMVISGGIEHDIAASHDNAPERIAAKGEINGHNDWRQGDQQDLMLAFINVPGLFSRSGMDSVQITATPYGSRGAWAVDFEDGHVGVSRRDYEFRVRPFRSIIHSSL